MNELAVLTLATFGAAVVNGALGYGFSSLTMPVGLLYYTNRVLNPAVVLVEILLNGGVLFLHRDRLAKVFTRVLPLLIGLMPGILIGSTLLYALEPGWVKLATYSVLLPLVLAQAAGLRWPVKFEKALSLPFGAGVGLLYSVTTISGPPLALMLNNQGFEKEDFRAALGLIRLIQALITTAAYYQLGLFTPSTWPILGAITLPVLIGVPLGYWLLRNMASDTFSRVTMGFDACIVSFGLSRALVALKLL